MPAIPDLQQASVAACNNVVRAAGEGLTDADVTAATVELLVTAIKARRDSQTKPVQRAIFDALIQSVRQLVNQGILSDSIVNAFSTVAADPFVAGVASDFLSVCATKLPTSDPDPSRKGGGGALTFFPGFSSIT